MPHELTFQTALHSFLIITWERHWNGGQKTRTQSIPWYGVSVHTGST